MTQLRAVAEENHAWLLLTLNTPEVKLKALQINFNRSVKIPLGHNLQHIEYFFHFLVCDILKSTAPELKVLKFEVREL